MPGTMWWMRLVPSGQVAGTAADGGSRRCTANAAEGDEERHQRHLGGAEARADDLLIEGAHDGEGVGDRAHG